MQKAIKSKPTTKQCMFSAANLPEPRQFYTGVDGDVWESSSNSPPPLPDVARERFHGAGGITVSKLEDIALVAASLSIE